MSLHNRQDRYLPVRPNLEQLKHQAKELLRDIRRGDPSALAEFNKHHPKPVPPDQATLADAREDCIEVIFVDQKSVVLKRNIAFNLLEVQRCAIIQRDDQKGSEANGCGQSENIRQKRRGKLLVSAPDDSVVESNAHVAFSLDG